MFGRRCVIFVLHLEHDGNVFHAIFKITENEITFGTGFFADFVVFFKVGGRESAAANAIEFIHAVLF